MATASWNQLNHGSSLRQNGCQRPANFYPPDPGTRLCETGEPVNREYGTDTEEVRYSYPLFSPEQSMPNWLGEEEKDAFM